MALNCNLGVLNHPDYKKLQEQAKTILRKNYNEDTFAAVIQKYYDEERKLPNKLWIQMHLSKFKEAETSQKNLSSGTENTSPVVKIISGGQTGVDTIGLQVAKSLGIQTGGTAPKKFLREQGIDNEDIQSYGLTEITDEEQSSYNLRYPDKRDPYTARTELNVRNSDGTIYFYNPEDKGGYYATKRAATEWGKPFLKNPTALELRQWIEKYNIKTLNIAGNRGSKLNNSETVSSIIKEALTMPNQNTPQEEFKNKPLPKPEVRSHWARSVEEGLGFEVSDKGDDLGKKFSPLNAVLPEGTVYNYGNRRHPKLMDLSGYSIEAAWAALKGYDQHGNKVPGSVAKINGYGKNMTSNSPLALSTNNSSAIYKKYLWLWKEFANANSELIDELRKKVTEGNGLVLTDAYAGQKNGRSKINQARALADILFEEADTIIDKRKEVKYKREMENAERAADEILDKVTRDEQFVRYIDAHPKNFSEARAIKNRIKNKDEHGNTMRGKDGSFLPEGIIAFAMPNMHALSPNDEKFMNPFEGQPDSLKKFVLWLMPDDFEALPEDLRVHKRERESLRIELSKGSYGYRPIFTNDTSAGIRYADLLRYLISNFKELRQKYNPVSDDIHNWAIAKQNVIVSDPYDKPWKDGSHTNRAIRFYVKEDFQNPQMLDDEGQPIRFFEVVQDIDPDTNEPNGEYSVHFKVGDMPNAYDRKSPILFTDHQKERLFKTVAASIPIGSKLSTWGEVNRGGISGLNKIAQYGFEKTDDSRLVTMKDSGDQIIIPVYRRTAGQKEMFYRQKTFYSVEDVLAHQDKVYLFGGNVKDKMQAEAGNRFAPQHTQAAIRGVPNAIEIPVMRNREHSVYSYFGETEEDEKLFKAGVDEAMAKARKAISEGKQVVVPVEGISTVSDMLQQKAPKLYKYLQDQLAALEEEANRDYRASFEMNRMGANVNMLDSAPVSPEEAFGKSMEDNPYVKTHRVFSDRISLNDAIESIADEAINIFQEIRESLIEEKNEELAALDSSDPNNADEIRKLQVLLRQLSDDLKGIQLALKHSDKNHKDILDFIQESILTYANDPYMPTEVRNMWRKAADRDILDVLFTYSTSIIEKRAGIRIISSQGQYTAVRSSNKQEDSDNEDDDEGKKTTGNDGWSFNVKLNDPYKSLTVSVRRLISNLHMKDPDDPSKVLLNSFGLSRRWDSSYIYSAIMSFMAKNLRNNADNFVTVKQWYEFPEDRQADIKRHYPMGYPSFPILEQMKGKYIWAEELIDALVRNYRVGNAETITAEKRSQIGNLTSQLYTNFNQQFIDYYIMKDGHLYAENHPTGAQSLKDATINNYEGSIMLNGSNGKPLPMIYNVGQSINQDNVALLRDKLHNISLKFTQNFYARWNNITTDIRDGLATYIDSFINMDPEEKAIITELSDAIKTMGMNVTPYDVMCIGLSGERDVSLGELVRRAELVLDAVSFLSEEDHLLNSGKGRNTDTGNTVEMAWKDFFNAFGEYVSDREYQSSFHAKDGTTRYSYSAPSFMSSMLLNLRDDTILRNENGRTILNEDGTQRTAAQEFIDKNFKPYAMFYDTRTGKWRNKMLEHLYNGRTFTLSKSHDIISIFNHNNNIEYSDWTPELIEELMIKEFATGTGRDETGMYIIPILSDKTTCKVVEGMRYAIGDEENLFDDMTELVFQEFDRIKLVRQRQELLALQNKFLNDLNSLDASQREKFTALYSKFISSPDSLNNEQKHDFRVLKNKYFSDITDRQLKYLSEHKAILELSNFDTHGTEFCFVPELNNVRFGVHPSSNRITLREQVAILLNNYEGNTNPVVYSLEEVLTLLDKMGDDQFIQLSQNTPLHSTSRKSLMRQIAKESLKNAMESKFKDWAFKGDKIRSNLENNIADVDQRIKELRENLPVDRVGDGFSAEDRKKIDNYHENVREYAYNFYLNHAFNMSQFIQIMTTDVAYFDGSNDFSKRWFSVYGAGQKLNTNSKYGKKTENYIILKDNKRRSRSYDIFKSALEVAEKDGRITNIDKEVILNKFKKINGTDAQALRSLTSFRSVMDMAGKWTADMERAYQNLRNNKWDMSDFNAIYQTIKPFNFSNEATDSGFGDLLRTPTIHKNSEAVLLAIYSTIVGSSPSDINYSARVKGINMAMEVDKNDTSMALRDENEEVVYDIEGNPVPAIDLAQYVSATKIGSQGVIDINYSRRKLAKAKEEGILKYEKDGRVLSSMKVYDNDTYDSIADRLNNALDSEKISMEEYNGLFDALEPDAEEVRDIIKESITSDGTIYGCMPNGEYYNKQVLHSVPYADYCIQQPTPEHLIDNNRGVFGSQIRHIIMSDLPDDFKITINGKPYDRTSLRNHYNRLIVANLMEAFENDLQSLFDNENDKRPPIYKLRDRLRATMQGNDKFGREMEQALDIVEDPETGEPTFALPLNNINVMEKLEEIMTSMFKNSITKQYINGGNAILAADLGYADSLKVIGKKDKDGKFIPGTIKGIECLLPANSKAMYEPFMTDSNGNAYGETDPDKLAGVERDSEGNIIYTLDVEKLRKAGLDTGIGYRIPTEGHYSAMPLIIKGFLPQQNGSMIVLAADVTQITGSDNDVDKENLFLKSFEIGEDGQPKVIKYDVSKSERHQSKAARDNEIIDIMYGILTHEKMADKWAHPGNFDNIKLNGKRMQIIKSRGKRGGLFELYKLYGNPAKHFNTDESVLEDLRDTSEPANIKLKRISDFIEKYEKPRSPIYLDTFIHYHAQNMAGVAEKGIFANNTINQAKLQWADVNLTKDHQFNIEGRKIKRVDGRYIKRKVGNKEILERISSNCAECSAASVDNAKDPVLALVNSNVKTAALYGYMLRTGLTIEEATLLLAQPQVNWLIEKNGNIMSSDLVGYYGITNTIAEILKNEEHVDVHLDPDCDWHNHNFTLDELYENITFGNYLVFDRDRKTGKANYTVRETRILKSLYRTYHLIADIIDSQKDYAEAVRPLHHDSPTHAIATSFAGMVLQTKAVEDLNARKYQSPDTKRFTGIEELLVYEIDKDEEREDTEGGTKVYHSLKDLAKISGNKESRKKRNQRLYDKIMDSELPITQAFYTLGIEKARELFGGEFAFGKPEMQEMTDDLCRLMKKRGIYRQEDKERVLQQFYRDYIVYDLSSDPFFGDDDNATFDEKRQYYLYKYPEEFLYAKANNPELSELESISRMSVRDGLIVLLRQGQMSTTTRDIMMDSFSSLQTNDDEDGHKMATNLMFYTYYLNGFEFSYMSFGNLFGTQFLTKFPRYIQALRNLQRKPITDLHKERYMLQFMLKRHRMGLLEDISYSPENGTSSKSETEQHGYFDSGRPLDYYGDDVDNIPKFITVDGDEVFQYSHEQSERNGSLYFIPLRQATSLHYNANQSIDEMLSVVYDIDLIRRNRKLGAVNRSNSSYQNELVHANNNPQYIDMTDQTSYSTDKERMSKEDINRLSGQNDAQLESGADKNAVAQKAAEGRSDIGAVDETDIDALRQSQAEQLQERSEHVMTVIDREQDQRSLPEINGTPAETDNVQQKMNEAVDSGQIDDPFCAK